METQLAFLEGSGLLGGFGGGFAEVRYDPLGSAVKVLRGRPEPVKPGETLRVRI